MDRIADKCEHPRRYDYAALVSAYGDGFDGMKIDRKFHDGESIEWEGFRIQVDWMPGQTEFGCCLWLEIDGKKVFAKAVYSDPEKYFTPEVLEKLDVIARSTFSYG